MKNAFALAILVAFVAGPASLIALHFGLGFPAWLRAEHLLTFFVVAGLAALAWHDYAPRPRLRKSTTARTAARTSARARHEFILDETLASTVVPL